MNSKEIILEKDIACTLRDGTILRADIYRPAENGKYPVLLTRLPYGKDDPFYSHRYLDTNRLVLAGFVVIVQDVRGRFKSDGDFFPFQDEAKDGYDSVEWAAKLPYADGNVGMFGLSYYGFTQLLAARERPPHLRAIFPAMTLNDLRNNMVYRDGIPSLASMKTWILESMVPDLLRRKYPDQKTYTEKMQQWAKALDNLPEEYAKSLEDGWPLLEDFGVAEEFFQIYRLAEDAPLWKQTSILNSYDQLQYPAVHLGGWYDSLLKSTIENYQHMQQKSNCCQRLIIGPWTHGDFGSAAGEREFGMKASESFLDGEEDLTNLHIRWFDHWLKGKNTNIEKDAPVKLFVMGSNVWRDEQEWPLARTTYTPYYFSSSGHANSRFGDGILIKNIPLEEPVDTYNHDPANPVPSLGGQNLYRGVATAGPRNQQDLEKRKDILVYTTPLLESALEVTGPVKVILWASSENEYAHFTAKLVDVFPDGKAYNLTDGTVKATFTGEGGHKGEPVCMEIDLWATSNVFMPGHAIRVEIASSNYPKFSVDKSRGKRQTVQTIYHDRDHPSHILLPII
ncbi:CocE/NonD family hydrolase [Virgibacillus halophilus]|uniref:CocE/NonD family hydrolase n=1 Tax=Tigheibacillus halophilus TaxID=361280 RepID=A0ABU5CAW5_9BACI|nr:CocE/NonD family hydrolase [Virgibacillus halophilus]